MSTGRIILLIVGVIIILISFGLIVGGGGILWANEALTDDELDRAKELYAVLTGHSEH